MTCSERKKRPGIYHIIGSLRGASSIKQSGDNGGDMTGNAVLVSEDGLMYAQGDVFSIGSGSDGSSILMFRDSAVTVAVIGEVLSIKNPVS